VAALGGSIRRGWKRANLDTRQLLGRYRVSAPSSRNHIAAAHATGRSNLVAREFKKDEEIVVYEFKRVYRHQCSGDSSGVV